MPNVQSTKEAKAKYIITRTGTMIIGSNLIGEKLTALTCAAMDEYADKYPSSVVFRTDGFPMDAFGMAYADTSSVAINLQKCWDHACEVSESEKKYASFLSILWTTVLSAVAHELDHINLALEDHGLYETMRASKEGNKDLEIAAKDAEINIICKLARIVDTEIPGVAEMGWFGTKFMELNTAETTKDLPWVIRAREMGVKGITYAEGEKELTSYRKFVQLTYEMEGDEWDQPTNPISLVAYQETTGAVMILPAEPVVPAVVPEVVDEEIVETTLETMDAGVAAVMGASAGGLFVGAGEEITDETQLEMVDASAADGSPTIAFAAVPPAESVAATAPVVAVPNLAANAQPAELTIPLAPAVAAQNAAFAAAAVLPEIPVATPYTAHTLTAEVQVGTMELVWKTLFHHIFTKCGWSQNPATGRFFFGTAAGILEHVNITHILTQYGSAELIKEYDTLDATGQGPLPELCNGTIRGHFTLKDGLPTYTIYLNLGGRRAKRTIVPQNPEKMNDQNAYTNPAQEAQVGGMIAWVFDGDAPRTAIFTEKCIAKMTNTAAGIVYEKIRK